MEERRCPVCRTPITEGEMKKMVIRAQMEEFKITGMCAQCQENIYGPAREEAGSEQSAKRGGYVTGSDNWSESK